MTESIEALFSPAEFNQLRHRDLAQTTCVVFDILRATSTMMTALSQGAQSVLPVAEIAEAVALRRARADLLLAGERHGLRILRDLTGGVDFDFGNSPREFLAVPLTGRSLAMTTTNGTRALRACLGARQILIGSFLGMHALSDYLRRQPPRHLILVCSGTGEEASFEDTLAAGALADLLADPLNPLTLTDSTNIARQTYCTLRTDLLAAMRLASNGRRLLAMPDLAADVPYCLAMDTLHFVAEMTPDGRVVRLD